MSDPTQVQDQRQPPAPRPPANNHRVPYYRQGMCLIPFYSLSRGQGLDLPSHAVPVSAPSLMMHRILDLSSLRPRLSLHPPAPFPQAISAASNHGTCTLSSGIVTIRSRVDEVRATRFPCFPACFHLMNVSTPPPFALPLMEGHLSLFPLVSFSDLQNLDFCPTGRAPSVTVLCNSSFKTSDSLDPLHSSKIESLLFFTAV